MQQKTIKGGYLIVKLLMIKSSVAKTSVKIEKYKIFFLFGRFCFPNNEVNPLM